MITNVLVIPDGTLDGPYAVPGTHVALFGTWRYPNYSNIIIRVASGSGSQLIDPTEIAGPLTHDFIIDWGGLGGASEIGACVVTDSRTGFSVLFKDANVLIRKEIAGAPGSTITANVTSGLSAAGSYPIRLTWNPAGGAISVQRFVSGSYTEITSGTYTDTTAGMQAGIQQYASGNPVHAFSAMSTTIGTLGTAISSIDQLIEGTTSTVTFSETFTPTELTIDDGASGIATVSSFSGSGTTWTFTCPAMTDDVVGPKLGTVSVTATDGEHTTASLSSTYAKAGYTARDITSLGTGNIGVGFSPALAVGNQEAYDATKGSIAADGVFTSTYTGSQTAWDHNVNDFKWRSYTIETIDGEVVVIDPASSQKKRRQQAVLHTTYYRNRFR